MNSLSSVRRYGRAIVGSSHWGDHLVARSLEDLHPEAPEEDPAPVDLLQAFSF